MKPPARAARPPSGTVVAAAAFKAKALAVMRHVHETGQAVAITSRGTLVRIEPVRQESVRTGYGDMRGTVELLVPDDDLVGAGDSAAWRTLEEWDEATRP
jgi:hypothetical protein